MNETIKPGRALFWFNSKSGEKREKLCKKYFPKLLLTQLTEENICFMYEKEIQNKEK